LIENMRKGVAIMADVTYVIVDTASGNRYPVLLHDNTDGTYSLTIGVTGVTATIAALQIADGDDIAQGAKGDTPASSTVAQTATNRTAIALLKGIINVLILANAKLTADPATETSLAAVLAKLSADPSTETTTAAVLAKLSADPATQTTLAAILALLPAALAAHGGLKIEGVASGVAVPVSGTFALETGGNLAAIKVDVDKIPSQGQASAAGSLPVVLPALQVTAMTPPANVGRSAVEVSPADQPTVDAWTDVTGSTLDSLHALTVSYTVINDGADTISWKILAGNAADFSDAVEAQASADVLAAAIASYSTNTAVWRYYKVQVISKVALTPGAALVHGIAKG
jgi:hypothetical protein